MNSSRTNLYILGGFIVFAALFSALIFIPRWQALIYENKVKEHINNINDAKDRAAAIKDIELYENSARLTIAQIVGGLVLLAGLYFTHQNLKIAQENLKNAEEGKLTDRFSKGIEMLESDKLGIRLGGISALEGVALASQKDHWTVMEILTAFVREKAPYIPVETENPPEPSQSGTREDIQAIMTVIGRRKWRETEILDINLEGVNLAGCRLWKADLSKAYLSKANLNGAYLNQANLSEANLSGAYLSGANLSKANLSEANLNGATLSKAGLIEANLNGAVLSKANLSGAYLKEADLRKVYLSETDLSGAFLYGANLNGARFITINQITSASAFQKAKLPPEIEKELKEWQAKQAEENQSASEVSSGDEK
jgi:uncharacterized protein YjbI with pentapeptide repeats